MIDIDVIHFMPRCRVPPSQRMSAFCYEKI